MTNEVSPTELALRWFGSEETAAIMLFAAVSPYSQDDADEELSTLEALSMMNSICNAAHGLIGSPIPLVTSARFIFWPPLWARAGAVGLN